MAERVTLIGLDFGTTTSSAVVAEADVLRSAGTGRTEFGELTVRYRSEMRFTPLSGGEQLDLAQLETYLDDWFVAGNVRSENIFGGGALLTGLTARRENAAALVELIRRRLGDALIATADDPRLESWLAFMGGCAALSRFHPEQPVLNLDIGGGTTNLALGLNGEVLDTACLFIGARHIRVEPGTYRVTAVSRYARAMLDHLGIPSGLGDVLGPEERDAYLELNIALLEQATGANVVADQTIHELVTQVGFRRDRRGDGEPVMSGGSLTYTGGVGELIYAHAAGLPWPETTAFGDLGIDLAQRIVASPVLGPDIHTHRPAFAGRATALGLMRHSTELSGNTLYLPRPELLPLKDVPIFGAIDVAVSLEHSASLLDLVRHSARGGCLLVRLDSTAATDVRETGRRIAAAADEVSFPPDRLLVLLVQHNLGKALGQYVTDWGKRPLNLVVIDEVPSRDAQYVRIGRPHRGNVPVSFYGLNDV
ncbi:MAG: ethanolamine ammonia-lyase reactivating factor EutA [Planctomycetaceae bacterium]|nr:ethanolamine ammonia-lyase reactivating factor EutA [Planctomycetaceae bacterium]